MLLRTRPILALSLLSCKPAFAAASYATSSHAAASTNMADLDAKSSQLITDAHALFGAKPTHDIFTRWTRDAIFEDPICVAKGAREYKAQWFGLAKAFSESRTLAWRVESADDKEIRYVQKQLYTIAGFKKEMNSTVVIKLNAEGKVTHFIDEWNSKPPPSNFIAYGLRRLNGLVMPLFVGIPKEGSESSGKKEL